MSYTVDEMKVILKDEYGNDMNKFFVDLEKATKKSVLICETDEELKQFIHDNFSKIWKYLLKGKFSTDGFECLFHRQFDYSDVIPGYIMSRATDKELIQLIQIEDQFLMMHKYVCAVATSQKVIKEIIKSEWFPDNTEDDMFPVIFKKELDKKNLELLFKVCDEEFFGDRDAVAERMISLGMEDPRQDEEDW